MTHHQRMFSDISLLMCATENVGCKKAAHATQNCKSRLRSDPFAQSWDRALLRRPLSPRNQMLTAGSPNNEKVDAKRLACPVPCASRALRRVLCLLLKFKQTAPRK